MTLTEEEQRELREFAHTEFGGPKTHRVTDRSKECVNAQPAVFYGPKPVEPIPNAAADAMIASLLETAVARGQQGGSSSSSSATSRVLLHARALVFIKPDKRPGEVWVAELLEALVALVEIGGSSGAKGKGKAAVPRGKDKAATTSKQSIRMSSDDLAIRYFSPSPESPEGGGVRFTFAYSYKLASYEAIWGTVDGYHSRSITGADLMGFTTNMSAAWPWSVVSRAQLHRLRCSLKSFSKSSGPGTRNRQALPRTLSPTLARKRPHHPQDRPRPHVEGGLCLSPTTKFEVCHLLLDGDIFRTLCTKDRGPHTQSHFGYCILYNLY